MASSKFPNSNTSPPIIEDLSVPRASTPPPPTPSSSPSAPTPQDPDSEESQVLDDALNFRREAEREGSVQAWIKKSEEPDDQGEERGEKSKDRYDGQTSVLLSGQTNEKTKKRSPRGPPKKCT